MKIETDRLLVVKNYSLKFSVSPAYVYKMIKEKTMEAVIIDGVFFIDAVKYQKLPVRKKKSP